MVQIAIVFHSGYGHTNHAAKAVLEGVKSIANVTSHICCGDRSKMGCIKKFTSNYLWCTYLYGKRIRSI